MSEYDKKIWQEEQAVRDAALEKQREKWAKAKERSARNAQRKLERLTRKLSEEGKLTDWEEEFTGSVAERLDKFGSAFQDPEKGRPADALSFAQKRVVAALNKKAKGEKKSMKAEGKEPAKKGFKAKGGFGNKNYKPRVRQLDDDMPEEFVPDPASLNVVPMASVEKLDREPFIPQISPTDSKPPFLRIVK